MNITRVAGDVWDLCFELEDIPEGVSLAAYTIKYGVKKKPNDAVFLASFPIAGTLDTSEPGVTKLLATVSETISDTIAKGNYWEAFLLELESGGSIIDRKTLGQRKIKVHSEFFI